MSTIAAMDAANLDIPVSKGHLRGRPAHLDTTPLDNREVKIMAEQTKVRRRPLPFTISIPNSLWF
jgi:hypothetical protein